MKRILYIKIVNTSFIRIDEELLRKHFQLKTYQMKTSPKLSFLLSLVGMKLFLLRYILRTDIVFIRFADHYAALIALFTRVFRKKLIIVVGGYDAVHIPEYNYGVYHSKFRGWCARYALRNADILLPNNHSLIKNTNTYSNDYLREEGIMHFVPDTKAEIKVIYNGFSSKRWETTGVYRNPASVLTVAFINDYRSFRLKGIDSFIELAEQMPSIQFTIVGISDDFLTRHSIKIPKNLLSLPGTSQDKLAEIYHSTKVFCLLSLTEGMPNVLCEAMLCGCIPLGSKVNSIPEIIGETGFIIKERNIVEMKQQLELALQADESLGQLARQRIIENFSLEKREQELVKVIEKC